jgi:hypothetical protein
MMTRRLPMATMLMLEMLITVMTMHKPMRTVGRVRLPKLCLLITT